jgi:5-dehydro-2-deoxygluconokinase
VTGLEIITMGRIGVDLYPTQSGASLAEVSTFAKGLGGSPTNVAVAAARLGRRAAVVTKVGADGFGDFCRAALKRYGVDTRYVSVDADLRTPIAFCELHPPDHFPLLFYREPTAPDLMLRDEDLDLDAIRRVPLFWTTGTGLSTEPSRTATLSALEARPPEALTVHDLDHRPTLWEDPGEHARWARQAVRHASVVVGNHDEATMVVGRLDGSALEQAQALLELGPALAIVKQGPEGTLACTTEEIVEVAPVDIEVVCGLGAGDGFGGMLCHALLSGWDLEHSIRAANATGAIVAGRLLCAEAMPTEEEVELVMSRGEVDA